MPVVTPSVRPITDNGAKKICTISGIQGKLYSQKLIELKDIENGLMQSIKEAEAALKDERFYVTVVIALKMIKVACDITIDIASDFAGPAGKGISMIYDRASLVTDGINGELDATKMGRFVAESHYDAFVLSLEYMGKEKAGTILGKFKTITKTMEGIYDIMETSKQNKTSGVDAAKRSLLDQLRRVRVKISELESELKNCQPKS